MNLTRKAVGLGLGIGVILALPLEALASAGLRSTVSGKLLDRLELPQQLVVSDRGADFLSPLGLRLGFLSDTTPPAAGHRVRVWNLTDGFRSDAPFTERDYVSETGADPFIVVPDSKHRTRWLSVLAEDEAAQQNDFRYEIVNAGGEVLESGEFSVEISLNPAPLTTTFRDGLESRDRIYPTGYHPSDDYGFGHSTARGRDGHLWNERQLFKRRLQFKRDHSPLYRLRERQR